MIRQVLIASSIGRIVLTKAGIEPSSTTCFSGERFRRQGKHPASGGAKEWKAEGVAMKTLTAMRTSQIGKFARFLEEHPGFAPELIGDNAYVYGFRVGKTLLSVDEMEGLIDTPLETHLALPQTRPPAMNKRRP